MREYELGRNDRNYREITPEEAEEIVQRWTAKWTEEDRAKADPD